MCMIQSTIIKSKAALIVVISVCLLNHTVVSLMLSREEAASIERG